jgi:hypothetical protein
MMLRVSVSDNVSLSRVPTTCAKTVSIEIDLRKVERRKRMRLG